MRPTWRSNPKPIHPSSIAVISAGGQRERRAVSCQFKHSGRLDSSVRTALNPRRHERVQSASTSLIVLSGQRWRNVVSQVEVLSTGSKLNQQIPLRATAVSAQAPRSLSLLEHPSYFIWSISRFQMFWRTPVVTLCRQSWVWDQTRPLCAGFCLTGDPCKDLVIFRCANTWMLPFSVKKIYLLVFNVTKAFSLQISVNSTEPLET